MKNKPLLLPRLRLATQSAFVGLAALIGARPRLGLCPSADECPFDATCPFGGIATLCPLALKGTFLRQTNATNLVLLGVLLVSSVFTGRAFCGWACPLGTVQGWIAALARRSTGGRKARLPIQPPRWLDRPLRWLKYGVLAWVLWQSLSAVLPPLIPFCPYRTLFTLNVGSILGGSVLVGFIFMSLMVERFWCRYLCPLGAALAPANKVSLWRIRADQTQCVSCGRCNRVCPMGLDVVKEVERGAECIRCRQCVGACPKDQALS